MKEYVFCITAVMKSYHIQKNMKKKVIQDSSIFLNKISVIIQRNKTERNSVLPVARSDPTKKYPVPDILDRYISKEGVFNMI